MALPGGQPGNRNSAKGKPITDILHRICAQEDWERLRKALELQLDNAVNGDMVALNFVVNRLEGLPVQKVDAAITHDIEHSSESVSVSLGWLADVLRGRPLSADTQLSESRPVLSPALPVGEGRH